MGFNDEFDRNPDLFPDDDDWQDLTGDDANDDDDDWLSQLEDDDDQPADTAGSSDDGGLDWISALEADDDEDEDGTPDWLAATGSLSEPDDESESEPSWLPDTGMLSGGDEDEAENTPNWLPDTGMLVGDDEADETAPTWLADTGMLVGASEDDEPDTTPDWLADSSEFDAVEPDDLPDDDEFSFDEEPVSDTTGADDELDLPDWMTGMPIPEAEEDSATDDDDWLTAFDEEADEIAVDDEPEPIAEVTDEDWLSELEDVDEIAVDDEPELVAEVADEDWLSELEDVDEIAVDDEPEPVAEAPDWLDDVDVPPVVSDTSNFDNLFDDLPDTAEVESDYVTYDDDEDAELLPDNGDTAQQLNTGYLRQMGLDGEDAADDDQQDWFAEPASELSELDDVEWLDELDVDEEPEPIVDDMGDAFPVDEAPQADATEEDDELAAMLAEIEAADDSPFRDEDDDAIDLDELIASLDEVDTEADEVDLDDLLAELSNEPDEAPAPTIDVLDDLLGYDDGEDDDFAAVLDSIDAEQFSPANDDEGFDLDAVFDAYEEDDAQPVGTDVQAVPADDDFLDEFDMDAGTVDEPVAEPDYGLERVDLSGLIDAEDGEIGEASAVAEVVGQYKDRPVEELDDRLKALREGGLTLPPPSESDPASKQRLASVVPNVDETLTPVKVSSGVASAAVASDLVMTSDQQKHVKLLQSIATGRADDTTLETDALPAVRARRPLTAGGVTRIAVMLILLAAVIAPFLIDNLRVGDLPPVVFPAGGDASAAYVRVQALNPDDRVLIAAEYGASVAGELDEHTRNIIAHALSRGAVPVLVSSDPVGLLRVTAIADEIAGVDNRNETYYPIQYIPAGVVGLRQLTTGTTDFFSVDSQGVDNGLTVTRLDDFQLAILITDEVETVRSWMEQVAPMTDLPFVVATAYSGMPLTVPYADSVASIVGLLVGYQDAYTYNSMLRGVQPTAEATVEPTATPTEESTATPTDEPTVTPTDVIVTEEAVEPVLVTEEADDTIESTEAPTATDEPTDEPTEASTATAEPTATNSPTPRPTNTPAPTSTPTETPVPIVQVATNDTESRLNVREVPDGIVVGVIEPGETVLVLDEDGDWLQVELPDETIGWVYAPLVEVEEIPETELEDRQTSSQAAVRVAYYGRKTARRVIVAPRQVPAETTAEPEATEEPEPTENAVIAPIERGDVRWHAMTMGVLVAAVLIALGNVFYLLRWLVRKGR